MINMIVNVTIAICKYDVGMCFNILVPRYEWPFLFDQCKIYAWHCENCFEIKIFKMFHKTHHNLVIGIANFKSRVVSLVIIYYVLYRSWYIISWKAFIADLVHNDIMNHLLSYFFEGYIEKYWWKNKSDIFSLL